MHLVVSLLQSPAKLWPCNTCSSTWFCFLSENQILAFSAPAFMSEYKKP